ncbi:hypothetical protein KGP26_29795 (plasmid) [Serratia sp. JSRIV002]|uniref:hypothetical protein n=1 Tax=Serratia sp. JSRIV002 TaxID=2831894 RepID=UPI001CBF835E|nr:hypothetical protein [Serratia sp. JSRIV002]UAN54742.1 hypothetical protein KGP26_29795 [Serratia sp. JSRIV002]
MSWDEHRERFAALQSERGITVKEYAEAHGLNPNTARRELKKKASAEGLAPQPKRGKKAVAKKITKGDQKRDHSGDHSVVDDSDHVITAPKKSRARRARTGDAPFSADTPASKRSQKSSDHRSDKKIISPASNGVDDTALVHVPKPRGGRRFGQMNEDCIIHGRYASPRPQDIEDALEEMSDPNFLNTIEARSMAMVYSHLKLMERARNRSLDLLDEEAEDHAGEKKEDRGTHPDHKKLQMLLNVSVGIGETAKSLSALRSAMLKARREEEVHSIKMNTLNLISMAYEQQKEHDWSYAETAAYIEAHGGIVPPHLMQQARIEATRPPEIDDEESTLDQDKLDEDAREHQAMRDGKEAFIAGRRALVAKIVDEGNYGDIDANGDGREGEFIGAEYESEEEFDDDLTEEELYGPEGGDYGA